ncbi:MAG TPA: aminoglycoside 6-adenylyltransferase, partial [Gemmatimonadota bacterium]|nr:aminoglycoside 6-adenylyltransferase [Gemmatimonadota bacterium]
MTASRGASEADRMLERIVAWAGTDPGVRGLALTGSRAAEGPLPDDLADIDVQVYALSVAPYQAGDDWLLGIGPIWVQVRDEYREGDLMIPTRLVVFERGLKVDFAFHPGDTMAKSVHSRAVVRVLLDKDDAIGATAGHPRMVHRNSDREQLEFTTLVEEFWFEAYHVGKYLVRGDLWPAATRHWATMERLIRMLEWRVRVIDGRTVPSAGKSLASWAPAFVSASLPRLFPGANAERTWNALFEVIELFRRLAR